MAVCKFFLQGRCAFGASCRNEHRRPNESAPAATTTGFGAKTGWKSNTNDGFLNKAKSTALTENITPQSVLEDLTDAQKPMWPFSVYSPLKTGPNLISGTDLSFEEARLQYYTEMKSLGNANQYIAQLNNMQQSVNSQINNIKGNPRAAIDSVKNDNKGSTFGSGGAFGGGAFGSGNTGGAFGGGNTGG
ncbi:hypothetical protein K7432_007353, partial [Basidiobolus ranarum]